MSDSEEFEGAAYTCKAAFNLYKKVFGLSNQEMELAKKIFFESAEESCGGRSHIFKLEVITQLLITKIDDHLVYVFPVGDSARVIPGVI